MKKDFEPNMDSLQKVFTFHESSILDYRRHVAKAVPLDWSAKPNPFRRYEGAVLKHLEEVPPVREPLYCKAFIPGKVQPQPVNFRSISQLFFDSLAISCRKSRGEDRWELRVNPSSGNLHPTEGYLICGPVPELCSQPMVGHYSPQQHGLEVRAEFDPELWKCLSMDSPNDTLFIGLTSIHWRQAWKYGPRGFRYCQLDIGHAIGAINYAAAALGWRTRILDELATDELALLTGSFVDHGAEPEEASVLINVGPFEEEREIRLHRKHVQVFKSLAWLGRPNRLSTSHVDWGMNEIAEAVRKPRDSAHCDRLHSPSMARSLEGRPKSLRKLIRNRRSASKFDGVTGIPLDVFYHLLQGTLTTSVNSPMYTVPWSPRIHFAILVHRVEELRPGVYFMVRGNSQLKAIGKLRQDHLSRPLRCPSQLELYCVAEGDLREVARQVSCFQAVASDSCFTLCMISEYMDPLEGYGPWVYPRLHWEAGFIGQVLYLEAEAAGFRSTGIGGYFDDVAHRVLGLEDEECQDLYHFSIGGPAR